MFEGYNISQAWNCWAKAPGIQPTSGTHSRHPEAGYLRDVISFECEGQILIIECQKAFIRKPLRLDELTFE
jgi:hypothetical protein